MDPYPHGTAHLKGKDRWIAYWHITTFLAILMGAWLLHVLFFGWYYWLFKGKGYLIRASDIEEDLEVNNSKWWNKYDVAAAKKAAALNDPDSLVLFTWRVHPLFMATDMLYIQSKGYAARIWDEREKIYHFR
ncbi:hypothetical protein ST201phi2-1p361 [Pseudomonas phage 201phi2-1]|uniref:Uncharacterized protein n=1 Tax=Pseudomonas phage 201phi2-1 TaxID=198110 RepID=B3FJM1_BP201|nr:hypothetical protein ST201phi2-1p361 [Pseudomonas phage 201phi2-1]ABY63186.1 hypothetical protein 201phi2-1p361 [Pseudomonas phage 201phi2-1]